MNLPIVLLYHAVAPCSPNADAEERGLFVDPAAFERQMDDLALQGFQSITLDDYAAIVARRASAPRSFVLTFDDAYAHVDAAVSPILRRHGFSAVMFACWSTLGGRNTWDSHHPNLPKLAIAGADQLLEMAAGSWEIASHALRHVDLRTVPAEQRRADLTEARERLSQLINKPVLDLAYPYGFDDPAVRKDVRAAGYRLAFTMSHTGSADPLHLARRPIRGTDSLAVFRLKASGWSNGLYRVGGLAPEWARSAARTVLGAGAR